MKPGGAQRKPVEAPRDPNGAFTDQEIKEAREWDSYRDKNDLHVKYQKTKRMIYRTRAGLLQTKYYSIIIGLRSF